MQKCCSYQLHSIAILFSYDNKKFDLVVYNNQDNDRRWVIDLDIPKTAPTTRYMGVLSPFSVFERL